MINICMMFYILPNTFLLICYKVLQILKYLSCASLYFSVVFIYSEFFSSTIPLICVCDKPAEDDPKTRPGAGGVLRPLESLQSLQNSSLRRHSQLYKSVSSASTSSDPATAHISRSRQRLITALCITLSLRH